LRSQLGIGLASIRAFETCDTVHGFFMKTKPLESMRRILLLIVPFCLFTFVASAQTGVPPSRPTHPTPASESGSIGSGSIRGRIVLPNGTPVSEAVKINLLVMSGSQALVYTDQQGQFEFRGLSPGEYAIEVEGDRQRFEVTRESVQVFRGMPSIVTLTLKEKSEGRSSKQGTVSVAELNQEIPSKARNEFDRASKAAKEGDKTGAIVHLRKAIEIYPAFLMARNDLGALLLDTNKLDEAQGELRRALEIDPKAFNPNLNLGIVLVKEHEFSEAVDILERASSIDASSPATRLYLGMALVGIENLDRGEAELKAAYQMGGREYSVALFYLGQLYMNKGQRDSALKSLELYLQVAPAAENSQAARRLIGMLQ
jgi:tetratricopeptide (TPR) repeat protein